MTLPLMAFAVFGTLLLAWLLEFRHREEILPTLRHTRNIPPLIIILLATLFAIAIVIVPLASLAEWPRSTQIAWIAAEAADRTTGVTAIGGAEHSAILGWPNGSFLPEMRVEPASGGKLRIRTRG